MWIKLNFLSLVVLASSLCLLVSFFAVFPSPQSRLKDKFFGIAGKKKLPWPCDVATGTLSAGIRKRLRGSGSRPSERPGVSRLFEVSGPFLY